MGEREITILKTEYDELTKFKTASELNASIRVDRGFCGSSDYILCLDFDNDLLESNKLLSKQLSDYEDMINKLKGRSFWKRVFNK